MNFILFCHCAQVNSTVVMSKCKQNTTASDGGFVLGPHKIFIIFMTDSKYRQHISLSTFSSFNFEFQISPQKS